MFCTVRLGVVLSCCLTALYPSGPASARPCGCEGRLPFAGEYRVPGGAFRLTYADGDAATCPTRLTITRTQPAFGDGARGADLSCQGGHFVGKEESPVGTFGWIITPGPPEIEEVANATSTALPVYGLAHSGSIDLILRTPHMVNQPMVPNGRDRIIKARIDAPTAAPCVCDELTRNLRLQKAMRKAHQDMEAARILLASGHMGLNPDLPFYGDPASGEVKYHDGPISDTSYQKKILEAVRAEVYNSASRGTGRSSATADTYATAGGLDCEISAPQAQEVYAACTPAILYKAVLEHEKIHQQQCRVRNGNPGFLREIDAKAGKWLDIYGAERGWTRATLTPQAVFQNNPEVLANDEALAYAVSINVIEDYLNRFCDS